MVQHVQQVKETPSIVMVSTSTNFLECQQCKAFTVDFSMYALQ